MMRLDDNGVLIACSSCDTMNRLTFGMLDKPTRCGKCKTVLPRPAEPIEVPNAKLFDAAVARSSVPILVDFWAAWCGPCRMMAPEVDKVAARTAGRALILKVDTDANPELGGRYGIRSIPTIMLFQGGKEAARASGVQPASRLEQMLEHQAHA